MRMLIQNWCTLIINNKNILMSFTVGLYIVSLYSVLSDNVIYASLILTIFLIITAIKNIFPLKIIFVWLFIFYFGIINTTVRLSKTDTLLNLAPINSEISGEIISIPDNTQGNRTKFFCNVNKIKFLDKEYSLKNEKTLVSLSLQGKHLNKNDLKIYNYYTFTGRLTIPFKAGNPSQFDYGNYLRNFNVYSTFYAKNFAKIDKELSYKNKVLQKINNYREDVIKTHSKYLHSPSLEILGGIIFGDDAVSPPQNIKQTFINSGLLHILAASGMNVAFIYTFFYQIMSLLKINFKIKILLGIFTILIYALMTGLGASIIRATCMLVFVLLGKMINRDAHSISLLFFVALLMLIYNPLYINDVGFQLSFIVTFGILITAPAIIEIKNKFINFIVSTISIPIIAQLWVIPVQIFYFNNISIYSVFANIMSIPILMLISFGGFVSSLLAMIKPVADFVCMSFDFILNPLILLLIKISTFWGSLPHAALQTTHPAIYQILIYYLILLLIIALCYKDTREKYLRKCLLSLGFLILLLIFSALPFKNTNLEILTFDVGNSDAFLIKTPKNEYIMIDTGKAAYNQGKSQAEVIIIKYFKDIGIKELNSIIVTHFDNDHCGGVNDIIKAVKVQNLYVNSLDDTSLSAQNIYKTAKLKHVNLIKVHNGQIIYNKNNLKITNYLSDFQHSDNDKSVITLLQYNKFSMLFTGDAGIKALHKILYKIPRNITVLKVPHHGAIGGLNKEIINYLNPLYSIISTGENKFGHPNLYTLELLKNTKILRTDIYNSILIKVKPLKYNIYNYNITERKYKKLP